MSTSTALLLTPVRACFRGLVRVANSAKATVLSFLALLVTSAVLYSYFEGKGVGDSIWWAVVTATTVGYGDTYPTTPAGRILAGILISGMVLLVIPLITAHFASKLIVDQDAFRHDEQEEIKENLRWIRAAVERLEEVRGSARVAEPPRGDGVEAAASAATGPDSSDRPAAHAGRSDIR